jgi:phage terminase small subunit
MTTDATRKGARAKATARAATALKAKKPKAAKPAPRKKPAATKKAGLTAKQQLFAHEYLLDLNATQAYLRAFPDVTVYTARTESHRLLKNPYVAAEIAKARQASLDNLQIDRNALLAELLGVATADPNELIQYRRSACSQCYPDKSKAERLQMDPNPGCEECDGEGFGRVFVADTRHLSAKARALYAGVKVTKEGLEVKMHSKLDAIEKLAKHLGLYKADNEQQGDALAAAVAAFVTRFHGGDSGRLQVVRRERAKP